MKERADGPITRERGCLRPLPPPRGTERYAPGSLPLRGLPLRGLPLWSSGTLPQEHPGTDHDERIGEVERGPAVCADAHVEEVGNAPISGAVDEVGDGPAQEQAQRPGRRERMVAHA